MIDLPVISFGCSRPISLSIVGERSASTPPSLIRTLPAPAIIRGTRLVVWAVNGEPSYSIILSALPWSAVISAMPPFARTASTVLPTHSSTASTAATAASNTPV